jgi:hypothetical protein
LGDYIKENETRGPYSTCGRVERFWWRNPREGVDLEDLGMDGRII